MEVYKATNSFESRLAQSSHVLGKYPDRKPLIVFYNKEFQKFLVPNDLTLGSFIYLLRKRFNIRPDDALFLFVNNKLFPTSNYIGEIYYTDKDADGLLYINVSKEATFG